MFKELKRIAVDVNQIKNQLELNRIHRDAKARFWHYDGTWNYNNGFTLEEYQKGSERAKKAAENSWNQ